jgi:integrase/recombinase XerD
MSVSYKIVLRTAKLLNNGEYPIMLRITINRQSQFVSIKKSSTVNNWDQKGQCVLKSHSDYKTVNPLLKNITTKIDLYLLNAADSETVVSFNDIKAIVLKVTNSNPEIKAETLFKFFESEIKRLTGEERLGYAATYQSTLNCLKNFTGNKDVPFINITLDFLKKYEAYLVKKGNATTTRSVYFRTFRTLFKTAITDKICPEIHYPFKGFAFGKYNNPRTKKRAISKAQIDLIAAKEINVKDDAMINSRNYFMFSFYCRGLNFIDLASLKWENIKDGEIQYTRAKTKEDFQFKLHPEAVKILEHYREMEGNSDAGYIFPVLYKRHNTPKSIKYRKLKVLKMVNTHIKEIAESVGIEKTVTTYVARHSYATALRRNGISKEMIGQSLGHNDLKTTNIYLDDIGDPVMDEMINSAI